MLKVEYFLADFNFSIQIAQFDYDYNTDDYSASLCCMRLVFVNFFESSLGPFVFCSFGIVIRSSSRHGRVWVLVVA